MPERKITSICHIFAVEVITLFFWNKIFPNDVISKGYILHFYNEIITFSGSSS